MSPDEQLHAIHQTLQAFVADHPSLATRPQGVLGILKDLETVEAFLTWCVAKGSLADIPGEAACIALAHLRWSATQDAILRQWAAERPEMAHADHVPGSPEAIEQMIACLRWRIDRGFSEEKGSTQILRRLEDLLAQRRDEEHRRLGGPHLLITLPADRRTRRRPGRRDHPVTPSNLPQAARSPPGLDPSTLLGEGLADAVACTAGAGCGTVTATIPVLRTTAEPPAHVGGSAIAVHEGR